MKGLAITNKGVEEIAGKEIASLINAKTFVKETAVVFDINEMKELCLLCYKSQSVARVLYLFEHFNFHENVYDMIHSVVDGIDFGQWLDRNTSFCVRCERLGLHDFTSSEIEEKTGEFILNAVKEKLGFKPKVNLGKPDIVFYVYINSKACYIGIDFAGFDLSKREYKIFNTPVSLKGNVAYALTGYAELKKTDIILDPFCDTGVILIEAALFLSNFPVNFYLKNKFAFLKFKCFDKFKFNDFFKEVDKKIELKKLNLTGCDYLLKHVKASQKNAKIAGVNKLINFSKVSIEWLDTKFKKNSVDKVITFVPQLSKNIKQQEVEKVYKEFFYQGDYILKETGKIVIISRTSELIVKNAERYHFRMARRKSVYQGKEMFEVMVFERHSF